MKYADELTKAMDFLAKDPKTIFLGQAVEYPGTAMTNTLKNVPKKKLIEIPVAEEMQLGISNGLALNNFIPISIFPRWNFLLLATNQLINHLDKFEVMSQGLFKTKVIIRTSIGPRDHYIHNINMLAILLKHLKKYCQRLILLDLRNQRMSNQHTRKL